MKDKYWIIIGFLVCIGVGCLVAFSFQGLNYNAYETTMDWQKVLYGGFMLGCIFFTPLALLILADRSEKITGAKK